MVNIDTVYQRVLAIANKEQRGYITPQEFNLFANQAQTDIFEQYFYDLQQYARIPEAGTDYSSRKELLDDKLSIFKAANTITATSSSVALPSDLHKIGSIINATRKVEIFKVQKSELIRILNTPLSKPSIDRPIYILESDSITIYPTTSDEIQINYTRNPIAANWAYTVVNQKPMYNASSAVNFELHISEQSNLVFKILQLAGISLGGELYTVGSQEELKEIQKQKQ